MYIVYYKYKDKFKLEVVIYLISKTNDVLVHHLTFVDHLACFCSEMKHKLKLFVVEMLQLPYGKKIKHPAQRNIAHMSPELDIQN